jgi:FKBP-type peptidyl-prolyl cis-trans isomerase (trigger factor)
MNLIFELIEGNNIMKVTLNKTENHMTYFTIETEPVDMEYYVEKVYQRLIKITLVPGYEKGATPRDVLEISAKIR